ncbi:MAG: HD-GYP domain-containing protein [Actinomycetota bacterium]
MSHARTQLRLIRYLPYAVIATCAVTAVPIGLVAALGVLDSVPLAISLSIATSIAMAAAGSWLWARHPGGRDLVFGDLILWGYLRRLRRERTIPQMIELVEADGDGGLTELTPDKRIETLKRLAFALEARDPYTHGHTERVARHAFMIAKTMGLPPSEVQAIRTAAAVHDVGKIHVPDEVLNKPGRLTDEEFALMKGHSAAGADMVRAAGNDQLTALVRSHHERIDGKGYPDRLAGDEIPLGARIIAVADTFDAITSTRSYRKAKPHRIALEILKKEAGTQLDANAVKAFHTYYSGKRYRTWWASVTSVPQQLAVRLLMWLKEAGIAQLANAAIATGAAVAIGGSIVGGGPLAARPAAAEVTHQMDRTQVASAADDEAARDRGLRGASRRNARNLDDKGDKDGRGRPGNGGGDGGQDDPRGDDPGDDNPGDDPGPPPPDDGGGALDEVTDTVDDTVDGTKDTVDDVVDVADDVVDDIVDDGKDVVDDVVDVGEGLLP